MLRKTATTNPGNDSAAAAVGEKNDSGALAEKTRAALAAADQAEAERRRAEELKNQQARARARTGMPVYRGCAC